MRDIAEVLEALKAEPFIEREVCTPHSGVITFADIEQGIRVSGPSGTWKEIPGTHIATITREKNPRKVLANQRGVLQKLYRELDGTFVEAGTSLGVVRHYLTRQEVVSRLLKESLYAFCAPERAKYYFVPDIDTKVKMLGCRTVTIHDGMELFIVSRMKREVPLCYSGPTGIIYDVYFVQFKNVDAGTPLIVVCSSEQQSAVEDVVARVQSEWVEGE